MKTKNEDVTALWLNARSGYENTEDLLIGCSELLIEAKLMTRPELTDADTFKPNFADLADKIANLALTAKMVRDNLGIILEKTDDLYTQVTEAEETTAWTGFIQQQS